MILGAISGSRSRPRPLVDVVVVVVGVVAVSGLVGVVGIIAHHHVLSPGTGSGILPGGVGRAGPLRPRARAGAVAVVPAVLVPSQEPLERGREAARLGGRPGRLLPLPLRRRLAGGVRVPRVRITDDGDRARLHLLLRCAPPPRRLILGALAQNAEDLAVVGPL